MGKTIADRLKKLIPGQSKEEAFSQVLKIIERRENVSYGSMTGLSMISSEEHPISALFNENGILILLLVALPGKVGFRPTIKEWQNKLQKPHAILQSRSGKNHRVYVWPRNGVATIEENGVVEIVEIFAPTSLSEYVRQFYIKPPEWTR